MIAACRYRTVALTTLLLLAGAGAAFGSDAVDITVTNNTTDDLSVTVVDLNGQPAQGVVATHVINGFASIKQSIVPDATGHGHLSWAANTPGGGSMRRCARGEQSGLSSGDDIHVFADTACPAPIK